MPGSTQPPLTSFGRSRRDSHGVAWLQLSFLLSLKSFRSVGGCWPQPLGRGGDATPSEDARQEHGPQFEIVAGCLLMAAAQNEAGRRVPPAQCGRLTSLTEDMLTRGKVGSSGEGSHGRVRGCPDALFLWCRRWLGVTASTAPASATSSGRFWWRRSKRRRGGRKRRRHAPQLPRRPRGRGRRGGRRLLKFLPLVRFALRNLDTPLRALPGAVL